MMTIFPMPLINTRVEERDYTRHLPTQQELSFSHEANYLFDASHLGLLRATGAKTKEFLQGQLSCDVSKLTPQSALSGLYCNAKGRIISYFNLMEDKDSVKFILPHDTISETMRVLNRYAVFSRVALQQQAASIWGLLINDVKSCPIDTQGEIGAVKQHALGTSLKLSNKTFLLIKDHLKTEQDWLTFQAQFSLRGSLAWHYLSLLDKNMSLYPQTQAHFLPHRLNLHNSGAISFDKGCYVGQEIIARTHYKAKLKHDFYVYWLKLTEPPHLKQTLTDGTKTIGEVVDYCPMQEGHYLISMSLLKDHPNRVVLGQEEACLNDISSL